MKFAIATACAVFCLSLAGAASAGRITATLETSQAPHARLIAARAVWNCEGQTCVADLAPEDAGGVSACRELAKQVGPMSAYVGERKSLDAKALDKCNAGIPAGNIGTASR